MFSTSSPGLYSCATETQWRSEDQDQLLQTPRWNGTRARADYQVGPIFKRLSFYVCLLHNLYHFFYKGITSTDTRSSSKNPNNPDGLSKENEFESNQHQEPYGTDIIFGAVNNDAEHPYELTSNRWNIQDLKTSQFHFRRSSSSRRLAWKSPVSSIVSGSLESESPSTDIYWSNGSVVRPPTMSIANEVKTSLKISCPWKVKTLWSTNNESQLFLPSISPASIKRFWQ